MSGAKHYEIQIPRKTFSKIMHWINSTKIEVSGFGRVKYHAETGVMEIIDAYLLPQEGGAAHTDIDGQGIAKLMYQSKDVEGELKWWWHSHVDMAVFWSSQDTATIRELGSLGWAVATVFNKREEMRSALCSNNKSDLGDQVVIQDELDTFIMDEISDEDKASWDADFKLNVKEEKPYLSRYAHPSFLGSDPSYMDDRAWLRYDNGMWSQPKGVYSAGSDGELVDITKEFHKDVPTTPDEDEALKHMTPGLVGYGIQVEAYCLGYKPDVYLSILNKNNPNKIDRLEQRLMEMIDDGKLDRAYNKLHSTQPPNQTA